jgi:NADH-quinone oxidoreductase subunit J
MIATLAFYVFAAILLGSATMVVSSRNPVHSVLFLVLAFFNAAGLFILLGAEFLAMILVIVYVGAVMVLFLFVVMMLDIDFNQLREGFQKYAPVGAAVGVVLFGELLLVLSGWQVAPASQALRMSPIPAHITNADAIGRVLYTDYILLFQTAGCILLVAMIGAIVLTHRDRSVAKRQNITRQQSRLVGDTLEILTPRTGAGVQELGIYRPKPAPEPAHHALPAPHEHAHEDH